MNSKPLRLAALLLLTLLSANTATAGWLEDWNRWTGYGSGPGYHAPATAACGRTTAARSSWRTDTLDMLSPSSPWSTRSPRYDTGNGSDWGYPLP